MRKSTYFASRESKGWPDPKELEQYSLGPRRHRWFFATRNDSAFLKAEGVDRTEHLEANKGRIDVDLDMVGPSRNAIRRTAPADIRRAGF
jgi:hypothetical protein